MNYQTIMTATLPVTDRSSALNSGYLRWYESTTSIVLNDDNDKAVLEPLIALSFVPNGDLLVSQRAYTISGPFGQDPVTERASIRHTASSIVDVGPTQPSYTRIAGRTSLNGIGRIVSFYFEEGETDEVPWDMVLTASHEYFDPLIHRPLSFCVIYRFGAYTPSPELWSHISTGSPVWIHGSVIRKDNTTACYVVNVLHYSFIL